jgi:hypothetical protein
MRKIDNRRPGPGVAAGTCVHQSAYSSTSVAMCSRPPTAVAAASSRTTCSRTMRRHSSRSPAQGSGKNTHVVCTLPGGTNFSSR